LDTLLKFISIKIGIIWNRQAFEITIVTGIFGRMTIAFPIGTRFD
jgi:hypothetical protein